VAAFVCQTNNPSTDKTLFTSTSAGRRKKRRKGAKPLDNESPAYAAGRAAAGSFPLERLLSVLASLCPPELRIAGVVYGVVDSLVSLGLLYVPRLPSRKTRAAEPADSRFARTSLAGGRTRARGSTCRSA
jgi:hypothetical protein